MSDLKWFLVDLAFGTAIEVPDAEGTSLLYVQAVSPEEAIRKASNIRRRSQVDEMRRERQLAGVCTECGSDAVFTRKRCRRCAGLQDIYKAKSEKKPEPEDPRWRSSNLSRYEQLRLEVLVEVGSWWSELPNMGAFAAKLAEETRGLLDRVRVSELDQQNTAQARVARAKDRLSRMSEAAE